MGGHLHAGHEIIYPHGVYMLNIYNNTKKKNYSKMFRIIGILCLLSTVHSQEQAEHRNFQYISGIDPLTGRYNFAYDTGNDNDIAHSLHMQYQDADGKVRGRYGYTDPRGKLRMVEYEAGPDGFLARGDVGPDMSLHDNTAPVNSENSLSSYSEGDFLLDPAPVQMAGWDPEGNPINQGVNDGSKIIESSSSEPEHKSADSTYLSPFDRSLFPALNVTSNSPLVIYDSSSENDNERYPRISYSMGNSTDGAFTESEDYRNKNENQELDTQSNSGLNINNIDVNSEDIRSASTGSGPVRRSADVSSSTSQRLQEQQQRSKPVKVTTSDGRRLFYRDSHSMEPHEHYYFGPNHDYNTGPRYYRPSQAPNYYTSRRYYRYRPTHTHNHDTVRRYYRPRQTHDHDAEWRNYRARQTHDHDAEISGYYQGVYRNGQLLYIDRHSSQPHAHHSQSYRNQNDHQHSDVHLYGRYRNSDYPATSKPRQLQYIPSDRYHDKDYYWTN